MKQKQPASPQRLAANRANAVKSTGPRTPEGKSASARNSVRHGLTSSSFAVIRFEEQDEIAKLLADLVSVYQPVNSQELFALERMALAQQSILRAARLETGMLTVCLNETLHHDGRPMFDPSTTDLHLGIEVCRQQNRNWLMGEGFQIVNNRTNSVSLLLRYQAQAERHYRRAVEEFARLKALRPELPNEPIPVPEVPESKAEPLYPTNPIPHPADPPAVPEPAPVPTSQPAAHPASPPLPLSPALNPFNPPSHPLGG